ncbi:PD-(D/E)XK nuclease family protein [Cardinium endosymbiont of Bemisia tabaci]|uniref:PD-(D/E)XK nuclease family protein n=1 Tax=Candidatus Cardinium TaxID=273135 RepID=UPI000442D344|nr:PD-(D/E)XK nuclease family protein [Cardinium endosymbiont of Bemisia tabaci]CDG50055.1 PD-(D/E)XK nuclease family protein [Cardinium endosymbiont cBtQ1 of Bemisia tabaci]
MKTLTHQPFLAQIIDHLDRSNRNQQSLLIFPTQLSIDYFQSLLNKKEEQKSVTCLTLHQFIMMHSSIKPLPTLTLLSRLYRLAEQVLDRKESFEQFYGWGLTLLQDFNGIDTHFLNDSGLCASFIQQKKKTVDTFVDQNLLGSLQKARTLSQLQEKEELLVGQQFPLLYESFRESLIEKQEGYEGLCYRMAQPLPKLIATYQELIFIGFNLLTAVEEHFIQQCKAIASTTFFWDVDAHYLDHPNNIAGHYLRQHRAKKWFQKSFPTPTYLNDPGKKVWLIEASSMVAQVQAVVAALQEKTNKGLPKFPATQTAIVVSGSDLLIPLLDQLSKLSIPLHCKLEYPFSATVIYTLLVQLVKLWEATMEGNQLEIYIANLLALCDPFVKDMTQSGRAIGHALSNDRSYQSEASDIWLNKTHKDLLSYLKEGLAYIDHYFVEPDGLFLALNKMALRHLLKYIDGLAAEMDSCSVAFLLNRVKENKMCFHQNHPITGLYIVEVSASYNLDFEHIFFLNMNEGAFPKPMHHDSFIPYDLRYTLGLPFLDKVAENSTAYGFYRLLQRAQNIYCNYVQKNSLDTSSEMNRLLMQLTFDSKLKIIQSDHCIYSPTKSIPVISIQKDDGVMQLLNRFLVKESSAAASSLTPSALIAYLSCPLQFYFIYLLQLKQQVWPKHGAEAVQLGTLFHRVMAQFYQPFIGVEMDKEMVMQLASNIKVKLKEAIAAQRTELSAPMLLHTLLEKLLARMVDLDGSDAPFTILGVEVAIKQPILLNLDIVREVWLSGVIDRIDSSNHLIRIIDYKTGLSNYKVSSIASLFDPTQVKKNKAMFQTFLYAWLFKSLYGAHGLDQVMPYLIHIRSLFLADYKPGIFIQQSDNGKKYQQIKDIMEYAQPFEEALKALLLEIFNPAIPFVQTQDLEICGYCPYVRICQRDVVA